MPNLEKLHRLKNEASSQTARIKAFAAKMNTAHEPKHIKLATLQSYSLTPAAI